MVQFSEKLKYRKLEFICNTLSHVEILTVYSNVELIANMFSQDLQTRRFVQLRKPMMKLE